MKKKIDHRVSDYEGQTILSLDESRKIIVELDQDHPGFRDVPYRERRNQIAQIAQEHQSGNPVPDAPYIPEENKLWSTILDVLEPIHDKWACQEYLEYWHKINFPKDRIPQMKEVTARLTSLGGFRFEPVSGLVLPKIFLMELQRGVLLATQYVRHNSQPAFTPEPDVVHEIVGHGAMLVEPNFVAVNRLFGKVADSVDDTVIGKLIRLYWWSIEFGLVKENDKPKAIGAGLLSSIGELGSIAEHPHRPFDPEVMVQTDFDPTTTQPFYFCADSSKEAISTLVDYLNGYLK